MDTAKSGQLNIIIPAYRMHTQTFINVLDGISEENALKRIDNRTNHLVWMAGNYVNVRYSMGNILGLKEEDPYQDLFYMGKALDTQKDYPTLKQLLDNFHQISPKVYQALLEADLMRRILDYPGMKYDVDNSIAY